MRYETKAFTASFQKYTGRFPDKLKEALVVIVRHDPVVNIINGIKTLGPSQRIRLSECQLPDDNPDKKNGVVLFDEKENIPTGFLTRECVTCPALDYCDLADRRVTIDMLPLLNTN